MPGYAPMSDIGSGAGWLRHADDKFLRNFWRLALGRLELECCIDGLAFLDQRRQRGGVG